MTSSKDAFKKRETSLENEFFHRVDQVLIKELQQQAERAEGRERLVQMTGIQDDAVLREMLDAGIRAETLVAFSLVPVIRVAFADRVMDTAEREAVLKAAANVGITPETASHQLLSTWLDNKPDESLFEAWKHYVQALCHVAGTTRFEELKDTAIRRAREVAEAAGGFLGLHKISAAEQAVLDEIETVFDEASAESGE